MSFLGLAFFEIAVLGTLVTGFFYKSLRDIKIDGSVNFHFAFYFGNLKVNGQNGRIKAQVRPIMTLLFWQKMPNFSFKKFENEEYIFNTY